MQPLIAAVDAEELAELHREFGPAPYQQVKFEVDSPFLDGQHQLLTSDRRRAEICYILHRGDPAEGVLLHRKRFYPEEAYRLPTGGIHQGETVLETLVREIEEETSFQLDLRSPQGDLGLSTAGIRVTLQAFLGTLEYEMYHCTQQQIHRFATYHFLIAAPTDAVPILMDPTEQLAGWDWRPLYTMIEVADTLDAIGQRTPDWGDWGCFRAFSHRFVAATMGTAGMTNGS
jgi:8-oxo-dGTP pyrophosphatase MutT (NUDIX family)